MTLHLCIYVDPFHHQARAAGLRGLQRERRRLEGERRRLSQEVYLLAENVESDRGVMDSDQREVLGVLGYVLIPVPLRFPPVELWPLLSHSLDVLWLLGLGCGQQ